MKPESRRNNLLTQSVGEEIVVYDERSYEAHRLNPTAAIVWRAADGERSISELSALLRGSLRRALPTTDLSEADGDALVRVALDELDRVGLLARGLPGIREAMTRREMIGATAALLPVIASILAPTPAMAQTCGLVALLPAQFNGTYVGPGQPGTPNVCGLGPSEVTITLEYPSMTIRHGGGTVFVSPQLVGSPVGCVLTVSGPGSAGPSSYQTTNQFTFVRGLVGVFTVTGAQQISYPECGTTPYNITATRR